MKSSNLALVFLLVISLGLAVACSSATANANNSNAAVANAEPAGTPAAASAESQNAAVEQLVAGLYKAHDAKKSPFFQTKDRELVDKYFAKPLADLIWKDANNSSGEVGAIDGDPLYNAQDTDIKNFSIGKATVNGDAGSVPVTFTNFGTKQTITFSVKKIGDAWKIDNISYSDGDSLMKWLKETYPDKGASKTFGEFEGKYQVGDTTCTVKPVKMAFAIRWAKGSGVEMYFSKDATTFESEEDKSGGRNEFQFDDGNYNTGTFVRPDGKTLEIRRVK